MICILGVVESCIFGAATGNCICSLTDKRSVALRVGVVVGGLPELVVAAGADGIATGSSGESETQAFSSQVSPTSLGTGYLSGTQSTGARQKLKFRRLNGDKCFLSMRQMMQFEPVIGAASQQLGRFDGYLPHAAGAGSSCGSSPAHCLPRSIAS